jgi:hypothetical protein
MIGSAIVFIIVKAILWHQVPLMIAAFLGVGQSLGFESSRRPASADFFST